MAPSYLSLSYTLLYYSNVMFFPKCPQGLRNLHIYTIRNVLPAVLLRDLLRDLLQPKNERLRGLQILYHSRTCRYRRQTYKPVKPMVGSGLNMRDGVRRNSWRGMFGILYLAGLLWDLRPNKHSSSFSFSCLNILVVTIIIKTKIQKRKIMPQKTTPRTEWLGFVFEKSGPWSQLDFRHPSLTGYVRKTASPPPQIYSRALWDC